MGYLKSMIKATKNYWVTVSELQIIYNLVFSNPFKFFFN